jgi:hypothetical protein
MNSSINYRHVRSHSTDLHHRAELARLAAQARGERRTGRSRSLEIPHPGAAVMALLSRPSRVPRRA